MTHPALGQIYIIRYICPSTLQETTWNSFRIHNAGSITDMKASIARIPRRFPNIPPSHYWIEWYNDNTGLWETVKLFGASKYELFSVD